MAKLPTIGPAGRQPARPEPLLRHLLGATLRRARHQQRRTLADVARAARVSMPYLSELERGRKEASSEVLAAVCDALHVELSDLLAEIGRELAAMRARRLLADRIARERARREGLEIGAGAEAREDAEAREGAEARDGAEVPVVIPLDAVRRPAPAVLRPAAPGTRRPRDLNALLAA
jgi:transcriptional regulator with XRE-family HTH domain